MTEKLLVTLPNGIGDAIQSIVGLRIALSKKNNIFAVVEPNLVRLLSKQFQSIKFLSNKSRDFFDKKKHFTLLINFNSLPWLQAKISSHQFDNVIHHTCFTDRAIKNGADCIYVNNLPIKNTIFFEAKGHEPKPAWTLYAKMAMLALPQEEQYELPVSTQPILNKNSSLQKKYSGKTVIGLFPGGSSKEKHWPIAKHLRLIKLLKNNKTDIRVFIAKSELSYMKHFSRQGIKVVFNKPIDKIFQFNDLDFAIANDTGLMHICGALGIGTLGIFHETTPKVWFTYHGKNQGFIKNPNYDPKRRYQSSPTVFDVYRYTQFLQQKSTNPTTKHKQFKKLGHQIMLRD